MRGTGILSMWIRSALVGPLFFALCYLTVTAVTAFLLRRKFTASRIVLNALALILFFLIFCLPYPAFLLQKPLSAWAEVLIKKNKPNLALDVEHSQRTAIVVLGGGFLPEGIPNPISMRRIERALKLSEQMPQSRLIISDSGIQHYDAAVGLLQYLQKRGLPVSRIILEVSADNTHENVCNIQQITAEENFEQIVLVTSLNHIPRSFMAAKKCGLSVNLAAPEPAETDLAFCPTWHSLIHFSHVLNEFAGLAGYKLAGWI